MEGEGIDDEGVVDEKDLKEGKRTGERKDESLEVKSARCMISGG